MTGDSTRAKPTTPEAHAPHAHGARFVRSISLPTSEIYPPIPAPFFDDRRRSLASSTRT